MMSLLKHPDPDGGNDDDDDERDVNEDSPEGLQRKVEPESVARTTARDQEPNLEAPDLLKLEKEPAKETKACLRGCLSKFGPPKSGG